MANWLDTAGHRVGTVGVRWVGDGIPDAGAPGDVVPDTKVVPLTDLR